MVMVGNPFQCQDRTTCQQSSEGQRLHYELFHAALVFGLKNNTDQILTHRKYLG